MPTLGDCTLGNFHLGLEECGLDSREGILFAVDWAKDGYSSQTAHMNAYRQSVTTDRGIDDISGRIQTGTSQIRLENSTKRFSPRYASSPIYPNVKPSRSMRLKRLDAGGTAHPIFTGVVREIGWQPVLNDKFATLDCVDFIEKLQRIIISTPLYEGYRSDELIATILLLAGYTGDTSLETGNKTFAYASWRKVTAYDAIQEVVNSEMGLFFVAADGVPTFHNRYHRVTVTANDGTVNNNMGRLAGRLSTSDIYNRAIVTVYPRVVGGSAVPLWTWNEVPRYLAPSEVVTLEADYSDPVLGGACEGDDIVTPVSSTDYTANAASDGSGTALTANISIDMTAYGQYAGLEITNGGTVGAYITLLQLRGVPITKTDPVAVTIENAASILENDFTGDIELDQPLETSTDAARDAAAFLSSVYGEPLDKLTLSVQPDTGTTRKNLIAGIDVGDRVAVTEPGSGYSSQPFFVNKVRHTIGESPNSHEAEYELSRALDTIDFVILDSLTQTFDDLLGY